MSTQGVVAGNFNQIDKDLVGNFPKIELISNGCPLRLYPTMILVRIFYLCLYSTLIFVQNFPLRVYSTTFLRKNALCAYIQPPVYKNLRFQVSEKFLGKTSSQVALAVIKGYLCGLIASPVFLPLVRSLKLLTASSTARSRSSRTLLVPLRSTIVDNRLVSRWKDTIRVSPISST